MVNFRSEKKTLKKVLRNLLITLIFGAIYFYIALPPINLKSERFYGFFLLLSVVYCLLSIFSFASIRSTDDFKTSWQQIKKTCAAPLLACTALLLLFIIGGLLSSVILRSGSYKELMTVTPGDFAADVQEISYNKIPMLDKASAERLGDRKLGELEDMVSQFEVSSLYSQINYKGRPVRVTYLEYGDLFKWFNNFGDGLPAYIVIDMVTQNVDVVRLEEGMKYSVGDHFGRYLGRYLRFNYPTFIFDTPGFEIDENGDPWWVCPRIIKTIGLFGGTDIDGAVLVNAVTGEHQYYHADEVPTWVDRVYSADLLISQYDYYGQYQRGFLNSLFGQQGVTVTTSGYNYIALDDDVYVYTGITSVGGDESNIGFILSNQRTKETRYYSCAGAEEYSAMDSAEGMVQHLGYRSTFPLLLNISGQPTYFIALKDNAGLVKMYAMVNVQQYNIVSTGATLAECEANYHKLMLQNHVFSDSSDTDSTFEGRVEDIRTAVIDGNSYYFIKLAGHAQYWRISAADNELVVVLNVGDEVRIVSTDASDGIRQAISIERK
ncbi:MAG: CvpA family protein [Clostridia bacterium]|nr:CvpA family protein [Clostridia bacterium]